MLEYVNKILLIINHIYYIKIKCVKEIFKRHLVIQKKCKYYIIKYVPMVCAEVCIQKFTVMVFVTEFLSNNWTNHKKCLKIGCKLFFIIPEHTIRMAPIQKIVCECILLLYKIILTWFLHYDILIQRSLVWSIKLLLLASH